MPILFKIYHFSVTKDLFTIYVVQVTEQELSHAFEMSFAQEATK